MKHLAVVSVIAATIRPYSRHILLGQKSYQSLSTATSWTRQGPSATILLVSLASRTRPWTAICQRWNREFKRWQMSNLWYSPSKSLYSTSCRRKRLVQIPFLFPYSQVIQFRLPCGPNGFLCGCFDWHWNCVESSLEGSWNIKKAAELLEQGGGESELLSVHRRFPGLTIKDEVILRRFLNAGMNIQKQKSIQSVAVTCMWKLK